MTPAPAEKATLLTALKEVTFFVAIYLYFMGFIYIYYFYDSFGIPLRSIDTPIYYFFVYSYNVITGVQDVSWTEVVKHKPLWTTVVLIILACGVFALLRRNQFKRAGLFAGLILLFPFIFYLSRETAKSDALGIRTGESAKEISFIFKKDAAGQASVRLVRGFIADENEPKAKQGTTAQPSVVEIPETEPPTPNTKCFDTEIIKNIDSGNRKLLINNAEAIALARFFSANSRADLCIEVDSPNNQTSNWPKLYLVTETSEFFYVILQPYVVNKNQDGEETYDYGYGYVYEVAKSDVLLSEVKIPQPE